MRLSTTDENVGELTQRLSFAIAAAVIFLIVVMSRLYYLQVHRGESYRVLSEQISVREEELKARRGLILDRNGRVLADNRPYFEVTIIPQDLKDRQRTIQSLTKLIPEIKPKEVEETLKKSRSLGVPPFMPVVVAEDAPYDWVARIREFERPAESDDAEMDLSGVSVRATNLRVYLYPHLFSHVLGYLKEVDKPFLEKTDASHPGTYSLGDLVGSSGVEAFYDIELKGKDGVKARVVDARGREIRNNPDVALLEEQESEEPEDGHHLLTSLDYEAQEAAAKVLGERKGAVVAMDPRNGEVIVLYSSPNYDPNRITKKIDQAYWALINTHENKYLFNRAVQAAYPPGSTYKMVPAFGALDSGKVMPDTHFGCGGGMQFGNRFFNCWNKGGHGSVEVVRSLMQSCDVYYYNIGLKLGVDGLAKYARLLGLGEKTGLDMPYETAGLIPTSEWKMRRYKQPWIESETLSISIGQGYDLVSPIQNARMVAMLANGGYPIKPHVGKGILGKMKETIRLINPPLGSKSVISPETLKPITEGMIAVVHGSGTAGRLRASPYKIAGKTGTAQVVGYESRIQLKDHALFVSYAPYDDPQIAVSVIVENGGHGGSDAAPVAMAVIDAYLSKIMPMPEKPVPVKQDKQNAPPPVEAGD